MAEPEWTVQNSRDFFRASGCDVSAWSDELVQDTMQFLVNFTSLTASTVYYEWKRREEHRVRGLEHTQKLKAYLASRGR